MICLKSLSSVMTSLPPRQPSCPSHDDSRSEVPPARGCAPLRLPSVRLGRTGEGAAMTVASEILASGSDGPQACISTPIRFTGSDGSALGPSPGTSLRIARTLSAIVVTRGCTVPQVTGPVSSRPYMPGYLAADTGGILDWSWAEERLLASHCHLVATTWPDGRPHVSPVWGAWVEGGLWFSCPST